MMALAVEDIHVLGTFGPRASTSSTWISQAASGCTKRRATRARAVVVDVGRSVREQEDRVEAVLEMTPRDEGVSRVDTRLREAEGELDPAVEEMIEVAG